ncbi:MULTISPECIES: glycosyltransferase family 61 protein [unclassified Aeromicrobium]|uniref:glycosyltransferase family 61 protein n=1 Tax=unclassified Aeromicrobium TaxID=2633570 RepID=UPI00396B0874
MRQGRTAPRWLAAVEGSGAASGDVVAIGLDPGDPGLVALAEALPESRIHLVLPKGTDPSRRALPENVTPHAHRRWSDLATWVVESLGVRPRAIVDHLGARRTGASVLDRLLWTLEPGGVYVLTASSSDPRPDLDEESLLAVDGVEVMDGAVLVRKATSHLFTVREWPRPLRDASGPSLDEADRIHTERAYSYASRATVHVHGRPSVSHFHPTIEVPERHLRLTHDVTCLPRMLATSHGRVLPSSFRHPHNKRLTHPHLVTSAPDFVRLGREYESLPPLAGPHLQLDSTYPGHFGHAVTEQLGHLWAWDLVRSRFPDARVVLTLPPKRRELWPFQREMLGAFGIEPDSVIALRSNQSVRMDALLTCTPAFENPHFVDLRMREVWQTLFRHLVRDAETRDVPPPERLFITRPPGSQREALRAAAIERFFRRRGFRLVRPETLTWGQQAWIFSRAKVIAGYGGSGMFNMMFNPDARVIVITGDAYTARNEHLFAAANGNEIHYFFGTSTIRPRPGKHDPVAFVSDFAFDLRGSRKALEAAIGG